jgi:anti-sigma factor RsiW
MTPDCQRFEELLSAHLDGEASPETAVAALEHALACPSCRAFYDGSRRLEREFAAGAAGATGASDGEGAPPERLWSGVRSRSGLSAAGERRVGPRIRRGWVFAAAAGVAAAIGLSLWLALDRGGALSRPGGDPATRALREVVESPVPAEMQAEMPAGAPAEMSSPKARMTDERFVAITRELLGSDPRYLRAMEGVLREVAPPSEGGGNGEDLPVRGERVGLMPLRAPV